MKHTPGPWQVKKGHIGDKVTLFVSSNGEYDGLHIHWGESSYGVPTDESEANAKLIAAAPDLLKALQEMLAAYLYAYTPAEIEARNTASDAIKKATE